MLDTSEVPDFEINVGIINVRNQNYMKQRSAVFND